MVSIPVMDRQKMSVPVLKLSSAFRADQSVYFQGLLPIIACWPASLLQLPHDLFHGLSAVVLLQRTLFAEPAMSHGRPLIVEINLCKIYYN